MSLRIGVGTSVSEQEEAPTVREIGDRSQQQIKSREGEDEQGGRYQEDETSRTAARIDSSNRCTLQLRCRGRLFRFLRISTRKRSEEALRGQGILPASLQKAGRHYDKLADISPHTVPPVPSASLHLVELLLYLAKQTR